MTASDKTTWFRRKRIAWTVGLVLTAMISMSLWYGSGFMERRQGSAAIYEQLPPLPETRDWPPAFAEALHEAMNAVSASNSGMKGVGELAMLFHANGFLEEADSCYTLLIGSNPEEPRWGYYQADVHLNWGDLESAESLLKSVVVAEPSYLPAHLRLGEVYFKSGKLESAHDIYLKSLQLDPNSAYALLGLARTYIQLGDDGEALVQLSRLVDNNRDFAPGYMLVAQQLEKKGEVDKAEEFRATGLDLGRYRDPPDPWTDTLTTRCYDLDRLTVLADMNVATREFDRALDILDRAESIAPEVPNLHLIRGMAYSVMGDQDKAITSFNAALSFGADPITVYGQLVGLYKRKGDNSAAISVARKGLKENPDSQDMLSDLGELLIKQGKYAEANVHLRRALEIDPSYLPALRYLARLLWEEGRESESMELFQEARRRSPLDFRSRAFLAQYYLEKDDLQRTEEPLREAIALEPESVEIREMLLLFLQQSGNRKAHAGDYPGAVEDYKEALAGDPENVELLFNLSFVYSKIGNFADAIESLNKYVNERPEDVNGWILLGDVAWEGRKHEKAREYWRRSLIVARGMQNSNPIIAAVEDRLRRSIPNW
jgi:tetratricopeptide (TPR) repeat protein